MTAAHMKSVSDRPPVCKPTVCDGCEIRSLTFCSVLSPVEIDRIRATLKTVDVEANTTLFREGDPADHLFNVTSGVVKIYKLLPDGRRQITGFLFPGDFLGLAYDTNYVYSAETVTAATLCRFNRAKLLALFDEMPHMEKHISATTSHELAAAQEQMLLLGRKTAQEKIASFLLMLARRAAVPGDHVHETAHPGLALPMNRADIGDYLGLTIETVSRTFTHLRKSGAIKFLDSGHAEIVDRDRLEALAEGSR